MTDYVVRASDLHVVVCTACSQVCRDIGDEHRDSISCPRCGSALHHRKPQSLTRTWALLLASAITYIPANTLPIMHTKTLLEDRHDTIVSGVIALWQAGSWELSLIVFIASVVVPLAKIGILGMLLISIQMRWTRGRRRRTRLFRLVDTVGHWSMLDIFVVVLMVAYVQFANFARVDPGPGAVAFGIVVVLTMLAAMSFDPRLIWDAAEHGGRGRQE